MKVSIKKSTASRKTIEKVNQLGLNRHIGEDNPRWKGGNRLRGNFPCPQCQVDRVCEKRNALRVCRVCRYINKRGEKRGKMANTLNFKRGINHWNWRGGVTPTNQKLRASFEYREWREAVFNRDNFTCQNCGTRGGTIHADHIKPWAFFPELRFDVNNGRTLCVPCHEITPTYKNRASLSYS